MAYNLSVYDNATGIMGIFEATSYNTNGLLAVLFIASLALLSYWILIKNNNTFAVALSVSSFGTLLISLLLRVREFAGVPMVPDWFVITVLIVNAFSIAALYITK